PRLAKSASAASRILSFLVPRVVGASLLSSSASIAHTSDFFVTARQEFATRDLGRSERYSGWCGAIWAGRSYEVLNEYREGRRQAPLPHQPARYLSSVRCMCRMRIS